MKANNNGWTPERRQRQSQRIHEWQPWRQSTGATTAEGKERAKMNAKRFTAMGLYKQACKICNARQLYLRGQKTKAWCIMLENEQYMAEREAKPQQPSAQAQYCRQRRRAVKSRENTHLESITEH